MAGAETCEGQSAPASTGRWNRAARRKGGEAAHTGGYDEAQACEPAPVAPPGVGSGKSSSSTTAAPAARCPICLDDVEPQDDACLPCGHLACATCVAMYLASCIDDGRVSDKDDLCCSLPSCRRPFPEHLISSILHENHPSGPEAGARAYERLLDFQARRFVPEPSEGERLVACPTPGCSKLLVENVLVEKAKDVTCPLCACRFCAACSQASHPGMTCESAELARMDPKLLELLKSQNWKRCPECRSLCERDSGCNFMTCPSERCQGKTHFCYLCGVILTAAEHASHFEGFEGAVGRMGPFGSVCMNYREADHSLPKKPPPPRLSVVTGEHEGTICLRITWGEHRSDPPTIYYKVWLRVPNSKEVVRLHANANDAHHDVYPKRLPKYRRYQATVLPVNVNGDGPESDPSEVVHFHERELGSSTVASTTAVPAVQDGSAFTGAGSKQKRWSTR
eukprot:TRINITY_DN48927_c0_g1_i2.p1 TRINITY_DN48927_c0_g1~~TRINITY_DN48927_c0_g1_i2.p1  ORF type:complete len:452 (+),score=23.29 TRINITY_DN48927_c0_g1_i2:61-1416(+)